MTLISEQWLNSQGAIQQSNVVSLSARKAERQSSSFSLGKKKIKLDELNRLRCVSQEEDIAIKEQSFIRAADFINKLPIQIEYPSLDFEDDGSISLEWQKSLNNNKTIITIVFDYDIVYSILKNNKPYAYGAKSYLEGDIISLINLIEENFGIINNALLKA